VLIQRRQRIAETYLTAVNPIVSLKLEGNRLTFENAALEAGVAKGPVTYRASWAVFDNTTGQTKAISETQGTTTTLDVPNGLPAGAGSFIEVAISAEAAGYPTWKEPVRTYFRRMGDGWKLVGLERLPQTIDVQERTH